MIAERESSHFEVVIWQSENHTFPGMPASQVAVPLKRFASSIAGTGRDPGPPHNKKEKGVMK